ncbi:MAG TPA: methyltransferase domain-containing protein [Verrucomicrobiae bacterium]|nr:methyltransferase domain-containing protein [Verrucomicrobiae bacterium]
MFNIHSIYNQVFRIWRAKRFTKFLEVLRPTKEDVLLDVGGYPWFWTSHEQPVAKIDAINIHPVFWSPEKFPNHQVNTLVGDGCALAFPDHSYDIGFSNSVIEHVGSWEQQQCFASEIRRVARALWVQTPAYECPFEPHYMAPFIHYLPVGLQKKLVRWITPWGWLTKPGKAEIDAMVETTRLLTHNEMKELFPDCEIFVERLLGLPKSYIAIRRSQKERSLTYPRRPSQPNQDNLI